MTTLEWDTGPGPRLHAFVVGVDDYPNAKTTTADQGWVRRVLHGVTPLTVAAPSARAVIEWLAGLKPDDENVPVGTVEVLISSPTSAVVSTPTGDVPVDPAITRNFVAAFRRWRARCNSHADNVALFFFCGHGWDHGEQLLLLSDIGIDPDAISQNCVDISHLRGAMLECAARTQLYFIDACRTLPADLAHIDLKHTATLLTTRVGLPIPQPDNPVFFSTARGSPAYGRAQRPTLYTRAVLHMLNGLAAHLRPDRRWSITTDRFLVDLREVIAWHQTDDDWATIVTGAPDGGGLGQREVRRLTEPPLVPVRVTCKPQEAITAGTVSAFAVNQPDSPRTEYAVTGCELRADIYRLEMRFAESAPYRDHVHHESATTPVTTWQVEVVPR